MRGHIRERSPGNWAIVVDIKDQATGKRRRKWHSFKGTKRGAQIRCSQLIAEMSKGDYSEPTKLTLDRFFDQWLDHVRPQVAPRSFERYEEIARKNLAPLVGPVAVAKLRPAQISSAYSRALESGRRDGQGGLSPRTVLHMHRVLKQALAVAVKWGIISKNPADAVDPPKVERQKMRALDNAETAVLLEHFRPTRTFVSVLLAVMCGMRRGEVVALKWRDVNLSRAQVSVSQSMEQTKAGVRAKETKSGKGRTIALPSLVVDELVRHRLCQAQEMLRLGARLSDNSYVVSQEDGRPLQPNSLTHEFVRLLAKAPGLPRIRFHDLRHSHATQLLLSGVHPKIAQERLGHSSIGVTLDLYSHVMPGMQEDAAAKVDAALRSALETARGKKG